MIRFARRIVPSGITRQGGAMLPTLLASTVVAAWRVFSLLDEGLFLPVQEIGLFKAILLLREIRMHQAVYRFFASLFKIHWEFLSFQEAFLL